MLVLHDGETVFSFGDTRRRYMGHSIRKPLLGALYGIYVDRGVIDPDSTLEELRIDDIPPALTAAEKRATLRDLARLGLLYQNHGRREGEQTVPEDRVRESTAVYPVENSGGDPCGCLWRIIPEEAGLGFHLLAAPPDRKLVLVHRVDTDEDFDTTWPEIRTPLEMIVAARELPG